MARERIFSRETPLWHAIDGWKTFPPGESDPGPAWYEVEGGTASDGKRDAATLKELADLTARAEKAETLADKRTHDLAVLAQQVADADAKVADLTRRADEAERAAAGHEADKLRIAAERDQANENESGLRNANAALKERVRELEADLQGVGALTAEDRTVLKAKLAAAEAMDHDGDGAPGGSKPKK
jgi:chromosome segregation ATPase